MKGRLSYFDVSPGLGLCIFTFLEIWDRVGYEGSRGSRGAPLSGLLLLPEWETAGHTGPVSTLISVPRVGGSPTLLLVPVLLSLTTGTPYTYPLPLAPLSSVRRLCRLRLLHRRSSWGEILPPHDLYVCGTSSEASLVRRDLYVETHDWAVGRVYRGQRGGDVATTVPRTMRLVEYRHGRSETSSRCGCPCVYDVSRCLGD